MILIVLVAMAMVAGGAAYLLRYEPLVHGDTMAFSSPTTPFRSIGDVSHVRYREGGAWALEFTIRNDGPLGVTVSRADLGQGSSMLRTASVLMRPSNAVASVRSSTLVAFAPFSLAPGSERLIRLQGTFAGCAHYGARTTETIVSAHVGFEILGMSKDAMVPLQMPVAVDAPITCPEGNA